MLDDTRVDKRESNLPNATVKHSAESAIEALIAKPPLAQCRLSIIVPARDEAGVLNETLRRAAEQVDFNNRPLDPRVFEIIVLANNCGDDTATIARRFQQRTRTPVHTVEVALPPAQANVGRARQMLMNAAFARLKSKPGGVIASTDADTRVAPDWAWATLREIEAGADAVCGRILIEKSERETLCPNARQYHLRDTAYRRAVAELEGWLDPVEHDPNPRHHQHFGASFAVTADVYRRIGGLPLVPHLEDRALFFKLKAVDARIRHSPFVRAHTSARKSGRAALGLSTQLEEWAQMGAARETQKVESLAELETWFRIRREFRLLWQKARTGALVRLNEAERVAAELDLKSEIVLEIAVTTQTFGRAVERVWEEIRRTSAAWGRRFDYVDIRIALPALRARLAEIRRAATA